MTAPQLGHRQHGRRERRGRMHDRRQVGVAIVEDVGAGGVEEGGTQRIDALAAADDRRLPAAGEFAPAIFSAISTGSVRQPASATAKKFSSARLASWRAGVGNVLPPRVGDEAGEGRGDAWSWLHARRLRVVEAFHHERLQSIRRPSSIRLDVRLRPPHDGVAIDRITLADLVDFLRRMQEGQLHRFRKIIDIANASPTSRRRNCFSAFSEGLRAALKDTPRGAMAIVSGERLDGLARLFSGVTGEERPVNVFRSIHEARKWLNTNAFPR